MHEKQKQQSKDEKQLGWYWENNGGTILPCN